MSQQDQHVVIVGGGLSGTVAALALRRAGIPVTVLEAGRSTAQASGKAPVVRLNPNAMDALRAVDAHQEVIAASSPLLRVESWSRSGRRVGHRLAADPTSERGLPRLLACPRLTEVLGELARHAGAEFRRGERVVDVERVPGGVRAVLAGGAGVEGTALIGADGADSTTRPLLNPEGPEPQHCGTRTVCGFTPRPTFEPPPPEVLRLHPGARALFAPLRDPSTGGCCWSASIPATAPMTGRETDPQLWRDRLRELFAGDPSPAASAVEGAETLLPHDDRALPHLPRWRDDRVLVIGDAAHVAAPAAEQGAGMAVEDGVVLARCLRDAPDVAAALGSYERLRRERVEAAVALGAGSLRRAHERGPKQLLRRLADRLLSHVPGAHPVAGPKWVHDHHIRWDAPTVRP